MGLFRKRVEGGGAEETDEEVGDDSVVKGVFGSPLTGEEVEGDLIVKGSEKGFLKAARERGEINQGKIGKHLTGIKNAVETGVQYTLGVPGEAVRRGSEAVASAGKKTWEGLVHVKDRLVEGTVRAGKALESRYDKSKEAVMARAKKLKDGTTELARTKVAAPLERRLNQIYDVPQNIRKVRERAEQRRDAKQAEWTILQESAKAESAKGKEEYHLGQAEMARKEFEDANAAIIAAREEVPVRAAEHQARLEELEGRGQKFRRYSGLVEEVPVSEAA